MQLAKSTYQTYKYMAISSCALVVLGGAIMLQPSSFSENANAETATSSTSAKTSVNLDPVLAIWTTDTSDNPITAANIAASPDESIATTAVRAHVSTNNLTGYTLTIQSSSTDAKMKHENTSVTKTIDPITGSGTSASSWAGNSGLNNMWGYSIGSNDSYVGVPGSTSSATTIDETDTPNNDNYTDVTFATKADLSLPAGTYTDTVIFSAVANALPVEYMQDADASWCAGLDAWTPSNNAEYTLKDSRDNLEYKIRKLADGHCWMAQNFRMTKDTLSANSHSATLDSSDTDISSSKSPSTFEMPNNAKWSGSASDHLLNGAADATKLPVDSSSGTPASGETAVARGAYYSWCTATADCTNDVSTGVHQENSICPKGWRLANPNNGSSTNANEYYKLFNDATNGYGGNVTNFNQAFNTYYSSGASYYLAGYWWADSSSQYVYDAGTIGYWWSSTSHSSYADRAWRLYAGTSSVYPTYNGYRYSGSSVRCML